MSNPMVTVNNRISKLHKEMWVDLEKKWKLKTDSMLMEWIEENHRTTFKTR